jgi:hypothetical protein
VVPLVVNALGRPGDPPKTRAPQRIRTSDLRLRRPWEYGKNAEKTADHDPVVTLIVTALAMAGRKDPGALRACVEALGLALGALVDESEDEGSETG